MPKMMTLYDFRPMDATIETLRGVMRWDDWLETEAARFLSHGRVAKIRRQGKYRALCVDRMAGNE